MLHAGSASLHWHGSRHGQPSVIADVRQKHNARARNPIDSGRPAYVGYEDSTTVSMRCGSRCSDAGWRILCQPAACGCDGVVRMAMVLRLACCTSDHDRLPRGTHSDLEARPKCPSLDRTLWFGHRCDHPSDGFVLGGGRTWCCSRRANKQEGEQGVAPNTCSAASSIRHDHSTLNPQSKPRPRAGVRGLRRSLKNLKT